MKTVSIFKYSFSLKGLMGLVGLLAVAAATTSCGALNNNSGDGTQVSSNSFSTLSGIPNAGGNTSLSSSTSQGFNCPALDVDNVVPNYNFNNNGTGYFQVCTSPSNPSQILVKGIGATGSGDQICAFAAETSGSGTNYQQTSWIPGGTGLPLYQCGVASMQQGVVLSFPSGTNFNSAFIVDAGQANQMYECLQTDNPSYCPQQYSYGEFR